MKKKSLYILWGVLFALCGLLGFLPEPEGALRWLMTVLSVIFFVPPALLLYLAYREGNRDGCRLIRNLAALSLGLTLGLLVLNLALAVSGEWVGNFLHALLVVISCPMICSGYWVLSLFLWACLLMAGIRSLKDLSD